MNTKHIIIAWIGMLILGSLMVYPAEELLDSITGEESFRNATDFGECPWRMER